MSTVDYDLPVPDWTISSLQEAYRNGKTDVLRVASAYVQKIADEDSSSVNAVITLNPYWQEQALQLQRTANKENLPLYGIPLLIKDNIDTIDMGNSAGSIALKDVPVEQDAPLIQQLRKAGALILGKTNLSEWANFRSNNSISGWSSLGGQTRNARSHQHSPSGSSSGSAAAVAMNYCVAAIGTETDGSIISPASHNGIIGLKPTLGRVSRYGIIPISTSQDTAGPMAKTAEDCAYLLDVLAAEDPNDPVTTSQPSQFGGFRKYCKADYSQHKRLGYLRPNEQFPEFLNQYYEQALDRLARMGVELVPLEPVASQVTLQSHEIEILCHEFPVALAEYFTKCRPASPYRNLADLTLFNQQHAAQTMPLFKQEWFERCLLLDGLSGPIYKAAQQHVALFRSQMRQQWFDHNQLDAIVCPANGPAWKIEADRTDRFTGGFSELAAVSGWPSITVPYAEHQGLPLGALFMSLPWQEAKLIGIAHCFELARS